MLIDLIISAVKRLGCSCLLNYALGTGDISLTIYWIIEGIFVVLIIISTFLDMYNIKKIASYGSSDNNIALYCALNLYGDFIILFIRVLYFVMLAGGRNKD